MANQQPSYRMSDLTWEEYEQRICRAPIFVPVGSTEQHGPALPLNVDSVIATGFAERAAKSVSGVVAPTLTYGAPSQPDSGGGSGFIGTTNLSGETLRHQVQDVSADLEHDGARQIVFFNGHYENEYPIREAIDQRLSAGSPAEFMIASWWDLLSPALRDEIFDDVPGGFPGWEQEHAGVIETSLMLHLQPDLVREDKLVDDEPDRTLDPVLKPAPDESVPETGVFYRATHGTADIGERIVDDVIQTLVDTINTEWM
jgi:creatinine amidohydrolase